MKSGQELINLLPPKIRMAFLSEVEKQKNTGYFHAKSFHNVPDMIDRCLVWDNTSQGSGFWVKVSRLKFEIN